RGGRGGRSVLRRRFTNRPPHPPRIRGGQSSWRRTPLGKMGGQSSCYQSSFFRKPTVPALSSRWEGRLWRQLVVPAMLIAGGLLALAVDVPLSRVLVQEGTFNGLDKALDVIEKFGNAIAVALIIVCIGICDAARWR